MLFFGKELISPNIKLTEEQLELLQVKKFGFDELITCLSDKKWLMKHEDEWFAELYHYFGVNMDKVNLNMIKLFEVPLIRLSDGENTKITDSIFFNFGNIPEFFTFIKTVKNKSTERFFENDPFSISFLEKFGVQQISPSKIVEFSIIPFYLKQINELEFDKFISIHLEHCLYLCDYYHLITDDVQKRLKEVFIILSEKKKLARPNLLYLTKEYIVEKEPSLQNFLNVEKFISNDYINYSTSVQGDLQDISLHMKKWRALWDFLEVSHYPQFIKTEENLNSIQSKSKKYGNYGSKIIDFKPSKELSQLLQHDVYETLKFLDYHWDYYKFAMEKKIYPGDYRLKNLGVNVIPEPSSLLLTLQYLKIEASNKEAINVNESLYGLQVNSFINIFPFYKGEIKNEQFRKYLGIQEGFTPNFILLKLYSLQKDYFLSTEERNFQFMSLLKILVNTPLEYTEDVLQDQIDQFTNQVLCQTHQTIKRNLKDSFVNENLILMNDEWYKSSELYWNQDPILFSETFTPALEQYFDKNYKRLFLNIGVNEIRPYEDIFQELLEDDILEKGKQYIFDIYSKINEWIEQRPDKKTTWILEFLNKHPILLTRKGMVVLNPNKMYMNDDDELLQKFKDTLIIFDPPKEQFPKLKSFIDLLNLPPLTSSIKITVNNHLYISEKHETEKFKNLILCIETYLYYNHFTLLEKLKEKKMVSLNNFELRKTKEKLSVSYELGKQKFTLYSGVKFDKSSSCFYISENHNGKKEIIDELSRLYESLLNKDFKLFVYTLLTSDDPEEYMEIIGLPYPSKDIIAKSPVKNQNSPFLIRKKQDQKKEDLLHMVEEIVEQTLEDKKSARKLIFQETPQILFNRYMPRDGPYYEKEMTISSEMLRDVVHKFNEELDNQYLKMMLLFEAKRLENYSEQVEIFDFEKNEVQENAYVFDLTKKKNDFISKYSPLFKFIMEILESYKIDLSNMGFTILCVNPHSKFIDRLILLKTTKSVNNSIIEISNIEWNCAKNENLRDYFYLYFIENIETKPLAYIMKDPVILSHHSSKNGMYLDLTSSKFIEMIFLKGSSPNIRKGMTKFEQDERITIGKKGQTFKRGYGKK